MLKKLFLPLFALVALNGVVILSNQAFAELTDPCAGTQGEDRRSCIQGDPYQQYVDNKRYEDFSRSACRLITRTAVFDHCGDSNIRPQGMTQESCLTCRRLYNEGYRGRYEPRWNPQDDSGGSQPSDSGGGSNITPSPSPSPSGDVDEEDEDEPDTPAPEQPHTDEYQDGYKVPVTNTTIDSTKNCDRGFLGMIAWYCNTDFENASAEEDITRVIVMIAVNIFTDITVIATYLVIGYIIYGGYQYIFANGDVGKVATGKKALNQAFIGLAITLSAHLIVDAIRIALMHGSGDFEACATTTCIASADTLVTNLIQWVVGICGVVAAVFVVGGGIMYTTSAGDPNKLQTAKNVIKYALIGLIIVALAEIITGFMATTITNAKNTVESSYINNTKEFYENQKIS